MDNNSSLPVDHCVDGRCFADLSIIHFFGRLRSIVASLILSVVTMGTPWWVDDNDIPQFLSLLNKELFLDIKLIIIWGISIIFLFIGLAGFYLRKRTERSLKMKYLLHEIADHIRDSHSDLLEFLGDRKIILAHDISDKLVSMLRVVSDNIENYFRILTGDNSIAVAIRLAYPDEDDSDNVIYRTVSRSNGLSSNRSKSSAPLSAKQGIARYLLEKDCQGVLIYKDLEKAADMDLFIKDKNYERFNDEIITMMVAPLNAWDGNNKSLIGIIYITSKNKNTFSLKLVHSAGYIADTVAFVVSSFIHEEQRCVA